MKDVIWFLVISFAMWLCFTGCGNPYGYGESYGYPRYAMSHRVRYAASPAYFYHDAGATGCVQHPLAVCLKNTTDEYHARCWVDEMAQPYMTYGGLAQGPVATQKGVGPAYLIPPGAEKPVFVSHGRHRLRCELYRGIPPYEAPPYLVTHQINLFFQPNGVEGRVFHLAPKHMRAARGLPAN